MSAFPISVIAYINGVKFYPRHFSVGAVDGGHVSFSLDVPAVPEWDALPERSHCAVFFADPIANSWRLMCEGEYIGYNRVKSAVGQRSRALLFRGLHAMWDSIQRLSIVGLNADGKIKQIVANGQTIQVGQQDPAAQFQTNYVAFLANISPTAQLSLILPALLDSMVKQSPVDTYYHIARQLKNKYFAFADAQSAKLLSLYIMEQMLTSKFNEDTAGKTLSQLLADLENAAMYHHVPLLAPPMLQLNSPGLTAADGSVAIGPGFYMPEMLFIPHLQGVIPPACNVVFTDQIADISMSRNFMAEPTRVIAQIETGIIAGDASLPGFIIVNNVDRVVLSTSLLNQSTVTFQNDQTTDGTIKSGIVSTHDLLTTEEYNRGVIPHFISIPVQDPSISVRNSQTVKDGQTKTGISDTAWVDYLKAAARVHFENVRAGARSAQVTCTFLPYIAVGFPCLIEDSTGPFWGIVNGVTHTLTAGGAPVTTMEVSHIREAYAVEGRLRNVPLAVWLCDKFYPANVDSTYKALFGQNLSSVSTVRGSRGSNTTGHSAMVPPSVITQSVQNLINPAPMSTNDTPEFSQQQINLDALAGHVMKIPSYTADLSHRTTLTGPTIAENIHSAPDPGRSALQFQFRPGVTLSQYAKFHGLDGVKQNAQGTAGDPDSAFGGAEPETLLTNIGTGHQLFGAPNRMILKNDGTGNYGPYQLAPLKTTIASLPSLSGGVSANATSLISPMRQNAAKMIKAAIATGITNG